jgi:hypothetical protein
VVGLQQELNASDDKQVADLHPAALAVTATDACVPVWLLSAGNEQTLLVNLHTASLRPGVQEWMQLLQSVVAEVIAALDVDVEALGGRRDIVMPTLDKVPNKLPCLVRMQMHEVT